MDVRMLGAVLMGISVPLFRPLTLGVGSPEQLAPSVFGISMMVAVLSGSAPLRALVAGAWA